jgi:hypothetical protein
MTDCVMKFSTEPVPIRKPCRFSEGDSFTLFHRAARLLLPTLGLTGTAAAGTLPELPRNSPEQTLADVAPIPHCAIAAS